VAERKAWYRAAFLSYTAEAPPRSIASEDGYFAATAGNNAVYYGDGYEVHNHNEGMGRALYSGCSVVLDTGSCANSWQPNTRDRGASGKQSGSEPCSEQDKRRQIHCSVDAHKHTWLPVNRDARLIPIETQLNLTEVPEVSTESTVQL